MQPALARSDRARAGDRAHRYRGEWRSAAGTWSCGLNCVRSLRRHDGTGSHDRTAHFRRSEGRLEPTGGRRSRAARHGSGIRNAGDSYNSRHAWCRPARACRRARREASATARPDPARRDARSPSRPRSSPASPSRRPSAPASPRWCCGARLAAVGKHDAAATSLASTPSADLASAPAVAAGAAHGRQRRGDRSRPRLVRLHRLARPARADPRRRRLHQDRQGRLRRGARRGRPRSPRSRPRRARRG